MALINNITGEYLRILDIRFSNNSIEYIIYIDQQVRIDEKNGTKLPNTSYQNAKYGSYKNEEMVQNIANQIVTADSIILNDLKSKCYIQLMTIDEFSNWISDEEQ